MFAKIWIWIDQNSVPCTGVPDDRNWQKRAIDMELVYDSQLPHRCVALTPKGLRIMTPTTARRNGFEIVLDRPFRRPKAWEPIGRR